MSPEPLLDAFNIARPLLKTQLRGIHILVRLFPVYVVPERTDVDKVNVGGSRYTAGLIFEP